MNDIRFGMANVEDDEFFCVDECAAPLGAVLGKPGATLQYRYDFGDDWEHDVKLEAIVGGAANDGPSILCTGGARACPPEDCGGTSGVAQMLMMLANPSDDEYADTKRWVGRSHDPEKFDITAVNKKLSTLARKLARQQKRS